MAVETKTKNYDEDPRYMNWNNGYVSIFQEIDIVNNLIFKTRAMLEDKHQTHQNLRVLHSKLSSLTFTYGVYIEKQQENKTELARLFDLLFNDKYKQHLGLKGVSVFKYQLQILLKMEIVWENITQSWSEKGLTIKVDKRTHKDPGKAILEGYQ